MIRNMKISSLVEYEPYKNAIREQTVEEFEALQADMVLNGQLDPIRIDSIDNIVLDGYSRLRIARILEWEFVKVTEIERTFPSDDLAIAWIRQHNYARRHFTIAERDALIVKRFTEIKEEVGERRGGDTAKTSREVSAESGVPVENGEKRTLAEMTAETVKKETGKDVSSATVSRTVKKEREKLETPTKEKPIPDKIKACIMFRRMSVDSWEALRHIHHTKMEAKEFVEEQREANNPLFDVEIAFENIEITFFTDYDKKSFVGIRES